MTQQERKDKMIEELVELDIMITPDCYKDGHDIDYDKLYYFILKQQAKAVKDVVDCVTEEVNLSNYDHETICRISGMWTEALLKAREYTEAI